jgi:hypothetical protein
VDTGWVGGSVSGARGVVGGEWSIRDRSGRRASQGREARPMHRATASVEKCVR